MHLLIRALVCAALPLAASASTNANAPQARPQCPSSDFVKFIAVFSRDAQVQRAYTRLPLAFQSVQADANPEPKVVKKSVEQVPAAYYALLAGPQDGAPRLASKITYKGKQRVALFLFREDTDYQVEYGFRRKGDCWVLEQISDHSL